MLAVRHPHRRARTPSNSSAQQGTSPEEKDGSGSTGRAYRLIAGDAVEDRAGAAFSTLPTLLRIALVFGVDLDHFFSKEGPRMAVTRRGQRLRLPVPAEGEVPAYLFESLNYPIADRRMDAYFAEFTAPEKSSKPHQHGSAEFIYVLSGRLNVNVDGEEVSLEVGDAMYFDSNVPHGYSRGSNGNCSAIVVTTP